MPAYDKTCAIENLGDKFLMPYLSARFPELKKCVGRVAQMNGDYSYLYYHKRLYLELKYDNTTYPNFFIETWSNKKRKTKGWVHKIKTYGCFTYVFLKTGKVYSFQGPHLAKVLFDDGWLYNFTEKEQNQYDQKNDTWGRPIPVNVLINKVGPAWSSENYLPKHYTVV